MFSKKKIMQKTFQVGGFTLLSRFLGIIREVLMTRYLGVSALSDAFITAYKIPNSLRKIFAEGALSAAFIPTIVQTVQTEGRKAITSLMTLGFLVFEGLVLILCALIMWNAQSVIQAIAPGFSMEQSAAAVPYLQILMPFIFFLSSSALLTGALQSVGHFFISAFSPVLLNIIFITGLLICLHFNLQVEVLCWFILGGGFLQFLAHIITYFRLHFSFGSINSQDFSRFLHILGKFCLCAISMSVMEVGLFIDTSFASFLSKGSISLIYYANRFMGIPLGVFAVAFSTILLPHFSRVALYAHSRLRFYLLESAKFIFWVTVPVALMMMLFSEKIFYTIFLSKNFTLMQVQEAATILRAFLIGLFFFSLNKILLNMYYALHVTWLPAFIAGGATIVNVLFNSMFLHWLQAPGLAFATTLSGIAQTCLFLLILDWKYGVPFYMHKFIHFAMRYIIQISLFFGGFYLIYNLLEKVINTLPSTLANFLLFNIGFWLWVGPLMGLFMLVLWYARHWFGIQLYFLG